MYVSQLSDVFAASDENSLSRDDRQELREANQRQSRSDRQELREAYHRQFHDDRQEVWEAYQRQSRENFDRKYEEPPGSSDQSYE